MFGKNFTYEQTHHFGKCLLTFGRTSDGKVGSRDFTVMANSVRGHMKPGGDFWYRYYVVAGPFDQVLKNARKYGSKADYGVINFKEDQADTHPLYREEFPDGSVALSRHGTAGEQPVCWVYDAPVVGSMPLFHIQELPTGKHLVTTDPYQLSRQVKYNNPVPNSNKYYDDLQNRYKNYMYESQDGKRLSWELLGYVMPANKEGNDRTGYIDLASIINNPGTRGMLALGPVKIEYSDLRVHRGAGDSGAFAAKVTVNAKNTGTRRYFQPSSLRKKVRH